MGTRVRIVDRAALEVFRATWRFHHPLAEEQLEFGGCEALVRKVGYYHGGDVLYWLENLPGTWHEPCLEAAADSRAS
jgi:hypothetical protein